MTTAITPATSSSSQRYFRSEEGYYIVPAGCCERAKQELDQGSSWYPGRQESQKKEPGLQMRQLGN
jgi:hypothetical protein